MDFQKFWHLRRRQIIDPEKHGKLRSVMHSQALTELYVYSMKNKSTEIIECLVGHAWLT